MRKAWIDLGTNVDRAASIMNGLSRLAHVVRISRTSSIYESPAYGPEGQPPFHNLCVEVETRLTSEQLRQELRGVEAAAGRRRGEDKFEPRTLDLDLILYEGEPPHEQLLTQAFVLVPMCELAGHMMIRGRLLRDYLKTLDTSAVRKVAGPPTLLLPRPKEGH